MHILPIQLVFKVFISIIYLVVVDGSFMTLALFGFCVFIAGNLLNRTLGLLKKNCQSTLIVDSSVAAEGTAFKDDVEKLVRF